MVSNQQVRVRIAPSPTGNLHVGTARAALYNELFAHNNQGSFVIRIEDTDKERSKVEFEKNILEGFAWLGLSWSEGPDVGGEFGPYRQSERSDFYKEAIQKLLESGVAYKDPEGSPAIFLKVSDEPVEFTDLVRGVVSVSPDAWGGDFVIARSEDAPVFHLAVVVDDALMKISHVIRGEDHISNTGRHVLLQRALGYETPVYAHLPLLLSEDRKKLSKRSNETSLMAYRDAGYLPQAMMNYLALLGWNPGDDREIFSHEELVKEFSLEKVQKGGAIFSVTKLDSINRHYLEQLSDEELYEWGAFFYTSHDLDVPEKDLLVGALKAERGRMSSYDFDGVALHEAIAYFFEKPSYEPDILVWKKSDKQTANTLLEKSLNWISTYEGDFTEEALMSAMLAWIDENDLGRGDTLWPMRVALTGRERSPSQFEVAAVLGKEETVERLNIALEKLA